MFLTNDRIYAKIEKEYRRIFRTNLGKDDFMTGFGRKALALAVTLTAAATVAATAAYAGWNGDETSGYSYTDENGTAAVGCWKYINKNWYRFDGNGKMLTGWYSDSDGDFYLRSNGSMARNWTLIDGEWYVFDSSGHPRNGWYYYKGNWYYLNGGKMLNSQWLDLNEERFYLTSSGAAAIGLHTIDGELRFFRTNGVMSKNWAYADDSWYYFGPNGDVNTGWLVIDGVRYFADANGKVQTNTILQIDGVNYNFDKDGALTGIGVSGTPSAAYASDGSKKILATGEKVTLTMYANYNVNRFGEILEQYGVCTKEDFLKAVNTVHTFKYNSEIPNGVFYRYEGYLYPDTYTFYTGQSADAVVEMMLMRFEEKVDDTMIAQFNAKGYSLHEAVTFASILQAEGGSSSYRYSISAVFQNRLASVDYPRLQSNPTRTYAQNYIPDESIAASYDTYQCKGLPIGPINNPGTVAFDALLNPDPDCDAFYFVSDKNGKVYFASTLEEHNANRELVQAVNNEGKETESSENEN